MIESVQTVTQGAAVPSRPSLVRTPSGSLSERRPHLQLALSAREQADFRAAVQESRQRLVSDAVKLPKSTNMGLGNQPAPQSVVNQRSNAAAPPVKVNRFPISQPIADNERTQILNEHDQTMRAHASHAHSWEESETFDPPSMSSRTSRTPESPGESKAVFLRAIPCMYVAHVGNATTFYKDILGFSILGKPDPSHVSLVRSPPSPKGSAPKQRGTLKTAPPDAVQVYLRIAPMGADGQRVKPPATTLWIQVNDVDEVHAELSAKWSQFAPRVDEYFPMHSFGDAKILAKPQNKAWGTREMHVVDVDDNKIIFFRDLH